MMLEARFKLTEHGTTVRTEVIAGVTTFLTMAYIIFVNPSILSEAGMDRGAVFVATCIASAIGTLVMALYANYPLALAPGMGLNAYFTFSVVKGMHYSWEVALGAVFISGVVFLILSLTHIRELIVDAIPASQKMPINMVPSTPISIAARTRKACSTAMSTMPKIASRVAGACRLPSVTVVAGLGTMMPALRSPMNAINRPMPPATAA